MSSVRDYLALCRFPAVFTAIADPLAGIAIAAPDGPIQPAVFGIVVASAALYLFGMVDNALVDLAEDRKLAPDRPLPSGRIAAAAAERFAVVLLAIGIAAAIFFAFQTDRREVVIVAALLLVAIVTYNRLKDSTARLEHRLAERRGEEAAIVRSAFAVANNLGPRLMGLCRGLNIMLGVVAAGPLFSGGEFRPVAAAGFAFLMTGYVIGLTRISVCGTYASRVDARWIRPSLISSGVLLIAPVAFVVYFASQSMRPTYWVAAAVVLLLVGRLIVTKLLPAAQSPSHAAIGPMIGRLVLYIIPLDATAALVASGRPVLALDIFALLIPAILLRRIKIT